MPQQQYLANVQKGMPPGQAMKAAYPGGANPGGGNPGPGQATAARPPMPGMAPPGPPGQQQGGARGSAVQQVLSAGQRLIQMASQLGILDQLKQMIAQADKGPGRGMAAGPPGGGPPRPPMGAGGPPGGGMAGGAPRPPMGGGMAGRPPMGGPPGGGMPQRKPPGMM